MREVGSLSHDQTIYATHFTMVCVTADAMHSLTSASTVPCFFFG